MKAVFLIFVVACFIFPNGVAAGISRIISGKPVAIGQLPHQVILKTDPDDELLCGGSIISSNWVLTAAHCTMSLKSVFMVFGTNKLYDYTTNMTSKNIIIHPQYIAENLNNDVSLIELPKPLTFSPTIQPIKLVSEADKDNQFVGNNAIIAGLGYTSDEDLDFSNVLLFAKVEIIPNSDCLKVFGSDYIKDSTMCAVGENGSDQSICTGDSGGPLIVQKNDGNFVQIGINSFVAEMECTAKHPAGYARLTSYMNFISKETGLSF